MTTFQNVSSLESYYSSAIEVYHFSCSAASEEGQYPLSAVTINCGQVYITENLSLEPIDEYLSKQSSFRANEKLVIAATSIYQAKNMMAHASDDCSIFGL